MPERLVLQDESADESSVGKIPPTAVEGEDRSRVRDLTFRVALALVLVAAVPLLMRQGRGQWFVLDEWDFLAQRSLRDPGSLFRPHNEHLVALPVVAYRVVYQFVGLRTYVPYQLMVVISHSCVVLALIVIARRSHVSRVLTLAAGAFMLFFGPGAQNIVWGFQIGLTGAVALGCLHVILADHSGPWTRRDNIGLASGVAAVLCTGGLGALMVGAAATVAWIRRGWRAGAVHLAPLVLLVGWMLVASPDRVDQPSAGDAFDQAANLLRSTVSDIAQGHLLVGAGLLAVTGAGLILVGLDNPREIRRGRAVVPLVLAATGVGVAVVIGLGRPHDNSIIRLDSGSRYVYLTTALWLPAIALAVDELSRRWRPVAVIAMASVALALPSNYRSLAIDGPERLLLGSPERILALGNSPRLDDAPADLQPDPLLNLGVTAGFLRSAKSSGRLGEGDSPSQAQREWADFALTIRWITPTSESMSSFTCAGLADGDAVLAARPGDILRLHADDDLATVTITKVGPPSSGASVSYWNLPPDYRLDIEFLATAQVAVQQLDQMTSATLCSPP